jgi:RNA polymerase sigma-70 factor (ECF subfamily)
LKPVVTEFQRIYDTFQPKVLNYLTLMVGPGEAEDLTQDVFLKAMQALPDFKGRSAISTWLYRIATNTALDRLRRTSTQRGVPATEDRPPGRAGDDGEEVGVTVADETPSAEQQLIREELRASVRADVLGVTVETVKIRLHRARARLKEALKRHGDLDGDTVYETAGTRRTHG